MKVIGISISIMLSLFIILKVNNIFIFTGNVEDYLKNHYGKSYPLIYDYSYKTFGNMGLVKVNLTNLKTLPYFIVEGKDRNAKLKVLIDYMQKFSYSQSQNDARYLSKTGGNCQALAVYFKNLCDRNKIDCEIIYTTNHMLNRIHMGDKFYDIDLVNRITKEVVQ